MIPGLENGKKAEDVEVGLQRQERGALEGKETSRPVSLNGTLSVRKIPGPI